MIIDPNAVRIVITISQSGVSVEGPDLVAARHLYDFAFAEIQRQIAVQIAQLVNRQKDHKLEVVT
jgi:hypothetical protein